MLSFMVCATVFRPMHCAATPWTGLARLHTGWPLGPGLVRPPAAMVAVLRLDVRSLLSGPFGLSLIQIWVFVEVLRALIELHVFVATARTWVPSHSGVARASSTRFSVLLVVRRASRLREVCRDKQTCGNTRGMTILLVPGRL